MIQKKECYRYILIVFDDFGNFGKILTLKKNYIFKNINKTAESSQLGNFVEVYSKYPDIRKQKSKRFPLFLQPKEADVMFFTDIKKFNIPRNYRPKRIGVKIAQKKKSLWSR